MLQCSFQTLTLTLGPTRRTTDCWLSKCWISSVKLSMYSISFSWLSVQGHCYPLPLEYLLQQQVARTPINPNNPVKALNIHMGCNIKCRLFFYSYCLLLVIINVYKFLIIIIHPLIKHLDAIKQTLWTALQEPKYVQYVIKIFLALCNGRVDIFVPNAVYSPKTLRPQ